MRERDSEACTWLASDPARHDPYRSSTRTGKPRRKCRVHIDNVQKTNVKYKENMTEGFDKKSNAFLSRQMQPNSTEHAGSHIMDRRRGIVPAVNVRV